MLCYVSISILHILATALPLHQHFTKIPRNFTSCTQTLLQLPSIFTTIFSDSDILVSRGCSTNLSCRWIVLSTRLRSITAGTSVSISLILYSTASTVPFSRLVSEQVTKLSLRSCYRHLHRLNNIINQSAIAESYQSHGYMVMSHTNSFGN